LFAFSNGICIDLLNNGIPRQIVKEDFIITTTGYSYPERNEFYINKMYEIINSLSDDPQQIKSILSLLSLSLWGENTNEIFAQLTGSGGNGKGYSDTGIKKVYGNYYQSINSNQLTDYEKDNQRANPELASCRFARVVMATEPEDSKNGKSTTLKVPTLKKWTGRDVITTRFLHKDSFSYTAKFTLMMQLNDLLDLSINDDAIKRRMKVIELPFKFVENKGQPLEENQKYRDESLKSLISTDEYRNSFLFILLDTWLENKGKFFESEKVKSFTHEFFETQNPVKIWFNQYYDNDDNDKISGSDMYNYFKTIEYNSTMSTKTFGRLLKECCKCKTTNKCIFYLCKVKSKQENKDKDDVNNGIPPL
jgi:phage/plasmid-associated DNA primase